MEENRLRDIAIAICLAAIEVVAFSVFLDFRFNLGGLATLLGFMYVILWPFIAGVIIIPLMLFGQRWKNLTEDERRPWHWMELN